MKLDQTIQRSNKSSGGVIGKTRNKKFVIEWELACHEILSICNVFRNVTNGVIDFRDTDLHHEFSGNLNLELNLRVIKVVDYINSKTNLLCLVKQNFIILVQAKSFLTISLKGFFVFMMAGKENT